MSKIITLTSNNFDKEVLKSDVPVLVDFWAAWCPACRTVTPALDELNKQLGDNIKTGSVNVDNEPDLANIYGVMSIPTFIVFNKGKSSHKAIGAKSAVELKALLGN